MTNTTDLDLDSTVKRFLELDAIKADIEIEQASLKAQLRDLGTGTHVAPCGVRVSVTENRRFNADKALQIVPEPLLAQIQTLVVDSKKAKAILPPTAYDACCAVVGEPRVSVR